MNKKNKMLTTLFLSPLAWQDTKAESFFEEMLRMQESMFERMHKEMDDMQQLFSKTFPPHSNLSMLRQSQEEQKTPEIKISAQEEKTTYIVTLNFENASLKESACDVEFEQTPQGQNLLRVAWSLQHTEEKNETETAESNKKTMHASSFISSSHYSSDKKTYSVYTNENGNITITSTYILPHSVSITDPIIKTDYETNSVEINLAKKETVKKYTIS
ncbi:hypothetical protein EBQ93_02025 [bacterium]|nr:hypothetical protein [bacterium]